MKSKLVISPEEQATLLTILEKRFEQNPQRHKGIKWADVYASLMAQPQKMYILKLMEDTEGEPDVVVWNKSDKQITYIDCAIESPKSRRSLCYDEDAWHSRKDNKPKSSALGSIKNTGMALLTEEMYIGLQAHGNFDLKTSSWIQTPISVRELGGAIFGDKRYGRTFIYHNGAESYYAARGYRTFVVL